MGELSGKTAIVTGAGSGIGAGESVAIIVGNDVGEFFCQETGFPRKKQARTKS